MYTLFSFIISRYWQNEIISLCNSTTPSMPTTVKWTNFKWFFEKCVFKWRTKTKAKYIYIIIIYYHIKWQHAQAHNRYEKKERRSKHKCSPTESDRQTNIMAWVRIGIGIGMGKWAWKGEAERWQQFNFNRWTMAFYTSVWLCEPVFFYYWKFITKSVFTFSIVFLYWCNVSWYHFFVLFIQFQMTKQYCIQIMCNSVGFRSIWFSMNNIF